MFRRKEHIVIAELLAQLDVPRFEAAQCYFGGGTAIVLKHDEYRLSLDVDFLCANGNGYRDLRTAAVQFGARAFFAGAVELVRAFRADQYGIRAILRLKDQQVKFEIVREARIDLTGSVDLVLGVPLLSTVDQCAEKLLANADRGLDTAFAHRDAIDLGMLLQTERRFPAGAIEKAERAYGSDVRRKLVAVLDLLNQPGRVTTVADKLGMARESAEMAVAVLSDAAAVAWPA